MAESVYKVIELVGTSPSPGEGRCRGGQASGEDAARLRVAEVSQLDIQLKDGKVESYRAKIKVSSSTKATEDGCTGASAGPAVSGQLTPLCRG